MASTISPLATLPLFNCTSFNAHFVMQCGHFRLRKLFMKHSRKYPTNSWIFSAPARRHGLSIVASATTTKYGDVREVSAKESEPPRYAWPDNNKRPRVCILGGGFGGLYTALRLESLTWPDDKKPQVVLIDQSERFVFKPLLYELLSGEVDEWEIAPRFSDLLANTAVQFFKDRVKSLIPRYHVGTNGHTVSGSAGVVHLESGLLLEYDWYTFVGFTRVHAVCECCSFTGEFLL